MKSFFKRLAFVMALAMVVSLAAPAAAQAAAANVLYAAKQGTTDEVKSMNMIVGQDPVDLCFIGAPKGWRDLERGWRVVSGDAVTVDQNGLVTAVKAGTSIIEFHMDGCESAVVTVIVEEEAPEAVVVDGAQMSHIQYQIKLGSSASYKKEDVSLYRIFDTLEGPVDAYWPIDGWNPKDDVITFSPFVTFGDGDKYALVIGGDRWEFTTVIPELSEISYGQTIYKTNGVKDTAVVTDEEEDDSESPVELGYELYYYNGNTRMDVTALFVNDILDVTYELVSPAEGSDELENIDFEDDGTLLFYDIVTAQVQAVLTYENADNEEVTVPNIQPAVIRPEPTPEYEVGTVSKWTLWKEGTEFAWGVTQMPAGENDWILVLEITDSLGQTYVTHEEATKVSKKAKVIEAGAENNRFVENDYWLEYYSTNTDHFLIDSSSEYFEPARIASYTEVANAVVYIQLHQINEDDEDDTFIDNIFAMQFKITPERKFDGVKLTSTRVEVMADAENVSGYKDFTVKEVGISAIDQYGTEWKYDPLVGGVNPNYELLHDDKETQGLVSIESDNTIVIDGEELWRATEDTSLGFTVRETNTGKTAKFSVVIKKPDWRDSTSEYDDANGVEGLFTDTSDVKHTVEETGEEYYYNDILVDQYKKYDKITFKSGGGIELAWQAGGLKTPSTAGGDSSKENGPFTKVYEVALTKTSKNNQIGYHDVSAWDQVADAKWVNDTGSYTVGDRVVAVFGPDGNYVPMADVKVENGRVKVNLIAVDDGTGEVTYKKAGTYKVVVYTVTKVGDKDVDTFSVTHNFTVKDNRRFVKLLDRESITSDVEIADIATIAENKDTTADELKEVVFDAFSFALNGEWKLNYEEGNAASVIESVTYKYQGDYIIIRDITFKIPVKNANTSLANGDCWYRYTLTGVNMSVELGVTE